MPLFRNLCVLYSFCIVSIIFAGLVPESASKVEASREVGEPSPWIITFFSATASHKLQWQCIADGHMAVAAVIIGPTRYDYHNTPFHPPVNKQTDRKKRAK